MFDSINPLWEHPEIKSRAITAENPDGAVPAAARA